MAEEDIKIFSKKAGNAHQKQQYDPEEYELQNRNGNRALAKGFGVSLAEEVVGSVEQFPMACDAKNYELKMQKGILLAFTAIAAIEKNFPSDILANAAENKFYQTLSEIKPELYRAAADSGAFSFYYVAFRRGNEVDRRIGQTFAMLCAHDGDSVYQELGEALFCWFISKIDKRFETIKFV
ncbi:MAG: hypothetical protein RR177_05530 [Oscillospiraceae bacterium]